MKRYIIISIGIFVAFSLELKSQEIRISYDENGNRVVREEIQLKSMKREHSPADTVPVDLLNEESLSTELEEIEPFKDQLMQSDILIYPNPNRGALHVRFMDNQLSGKAVLSLYDMSGKLLIKENTGSTLHSIDMSAYSSGSYILRIQVKDTVKEWQIMKE